MLGDGYPATRRSPNGKAMALCISVVLIQKGLSIKLLSDPFTFQQTSLVQLCIHLLRSVEFSCHRDAFQRQLHTMADERVQLKEDQQDGPLFLALLMGNNNNNANAAK